MGPISVPYPSIVAGEDVVGQPESPSYSGHKSKVLPPKLDGLSVEEGWCPWKIIVLLSGDRKTGIKQAKQQISVLSLR